VNMGKTEAVNTALSWARQHGTDVLVFIDGDGQHNPEEIEQVLAPVISGQADMVVGSRFLKVRSDIPFYRKVGQHALTTVTNVASAAPITDSQSGFRAFSRRAIEVLSFQGTGLSVESEMQFQAKAHGLTITEVPISVIYAEKAKRNPFTHGMQIITNILQLVGQHRPLFFFGFLGLVFLAVGSLLGAVTVGAYSDTHALAVGYALLSVLMLILGMAALFVGLILHSVHSSFEELKRTLARERAFEGQY
jgi:glycosyltransferase involved in cell wall biosynthesis